MAGAFIAVQRKNLPSITSSNSNSNSSSISVGSDDVLQVLQIQEEKEKQERQAMKARRDKATESSRQRLAKQQQKDRYVQPDTNTTSISSRPPSKPLKVGYPIFVLNLPKTGTTTIWQYFECGLGRDRAVHWWTTPQGHGNQKKIGPCVEYNIQMSEAKGPLHRCGDFDVWVDFGYATATQCFFPAVHGYEALYEAYPHATFLLISRDVDQWFQSAAGWGPMFRKWSTACRSAFFPDIPPTQEITQDDLREFYPRSMDTIRQFAQTHPDMNFIEPPPGITLSSPELPKWLEDTIGIEASCWGKCQPHGTRAKCE